MNPVTPHAFINLGAIPRVKKATDYLIGSAVAYNYPSVAMSALAFAAPIYYQGERPACGAHAGTWLRMYLARLKGVNVNENDTPRFTWMEIKKDGTSASIGTSLDRIFTVLKYPGTVAFEPLENNVTYDDFDYANPASIALNLAQQIALMKGKQLIASYAYPQDQSFSGIKQSIDNFGAAILEIELSERFWTAANGQTSWAEKDILPLAPPSSKFPVVSSHYVVAHSYDENYIYFANSFGDTWGRNGHGYFGADYIPFVADVGVATLSVPAVTVDSVATVQKAIPVVQDAIAKLNTLPPDQKQHHISLIQELLNDLAELLSGHASTSTSA